MLNFTLNMLVSMIPYDYSAIASQNGLRTTVLESGFFNISYREASSISPTGNVDSTPTLRTPPNLKHTHRYLCWKMFPSVLSLGEWGGSLLKIPSPTPSFV